MTAFKDTPICFVLLGGCEGIDFMNDKPFQYFHINQCMVFLTKNLGNAMTIVTLFLLKLTVFDQK